jgi:hypothetical protein
MLDVRIDRSDSTLLPDQVATAPTEQPPDRQADTALDVVQAGVIKEAKRRQRRRRAVTALVLLVAGLVAVVVLPGGKEPGGSSRRLGQQPSALLALDPSALFSQDPYMGVACGVANSIACDRIGLTVWLRHPAQAVVAIVGGRSFRLDDPAWSGPAIHGVRNQFAGFLQPAGITTRLGVSTQQGTHWDGSSGPSPLTMLTIMRRGQPPIQAWINVSLQAGWG